MMETKEPQQNENRGKKMTKWNKHLHQQEIMKRGKKLHSMAFPLFAPLHRQIPRKIADAMYRVPCTYVRLKKSNV